MKFILLTIALMLSAPVFAQEEAFKGESEAPLRLQHLIEVNINYIVTQRIPMSQFGIFHVTIITSYMSCLAQEVVLYNEQAETNPDLEFVDFHPRPYYGNKALMWQEHLEAYIRSVVVLFNDPTLQNRYDVKYEEVLAVFMDLQSVILNNKDRPQDRVQAIKSCDEYFVYLERDEDEIQLLIEAGEPPLYTYAE